MNSLFINETALHTRPLHPPPGALLPAPDCHGKEGIATFCRLPGEYRLQLASLCLGRVCPANVRDKSWSADQRLLRMNLQRERGSKSY